MKQIFDWLRERAMSNEYLYKVDGFHFLSRAEISELINEAEAKWESDCCEWKLTEYSDFIFETSCGEKEEHCSFWKYCPDCGKPIKILEVE